MKKRVLALLLAAAMIVTVFAACGSSESSSAGGNNASTADNSTAVGGDDGSSAANSGLSVSTGPDDTSERYAFTVYYNYTGWSRSWGQDEASQYMSDKFNIDVNWYGPDSDPDAKLNIMLSSDDLPESVVMNRDSNLIKMVQGGFLQPLQQYMYEGNLLEKFVAPATLDLLKTDDGNGNKYNYGVPNWPRTGATGGNYLYMISKNVYDQVGNERQFETMEDLHQFMVDVKNSGATSYNGQSVYPWLMYPDNSSSGYYVWWPIYRALGMPNVTGDNYLYTQEDGKIGFVADSDNWVKAVKYANTWFNEGLFDETSFTDSTDQFLEKVTNGRFGVLWYDQSQDDGNNFRRTIVENSNGSDDALALGTEFFQDDCLLYPGLEGATITFGDENGTVGWNVNTVTKKAERPQRIFDLWSWMLSDEGSVNMMYGPEGGSMLKSVVYHDDGTMPDVTLQKDNPTSDEQNAAGAWFWSQPANSDYVDGIKFALNDKLDPEKRNWVVSIQAHSQSYNDDNPEIGSKFITDQSTGLTDTIDGQSDLGVARQQIADYAKQQVPKIIMASSEDEFNSLVEDLKNFAHSNSVDDICATYQAKWDDNVAIQGFNAYDPDYDVYKTK